MKNLRRLSVKATKWCQLSGYNTILIRQNMKSASFAIQVCETKSEMLEHGVDYTYPYVLFNPYNMKIKS